MRLRPTSLGLAGFLLLGLAQLPAAFAHGGAETGSMHGEHAPQAESEEPAADVEYLPTYFSHPDHVALLYAHVTLMVLAWVFALPVAVMLSLAKSRYTLLLQLAFTATNGAGVFLASIYNAETPDLYPNNAHHGIGWVATSLTFAQFAASSLTWVAHRVKSSTLRFVAPERQAFLPVTTAERSGEQAGQHDGYFGCLHLSNDDGQSSRSPQSHRSSLASTVIDDEEGLPMPSPHKEYGNNEEDNLAHAQENGARTQGSWQKRALFFVYSKFWTYVATAYKVIDRIILPLGFIALTTGIVTMGRLFEGNEIFSGLAHWIKGGVFFWLGLFTLGRWSGSFGELGWAWNIRPQSSSAKWCPSAEFVESALIFFYGSTNIFMEHLGSWGEEWSAQDFEHLAITILFIGGGLCGMLIESTRIRNLLNVATVYAIPEQRYSDEEEHTRPKEPDTYEFSLNPIPALVILLLGIMMSSHHQETMISTMVHKQWGNLLVGASFARSLTYILIFLRPPTSALPSRPPTELLTSFGLISGGIIFMASSSDTIQGMIHYGLDAMFMYTVTMGFVGLLMAWEIVVLAIKGLATRIERRAESTRY